MRMTKTFRRRQKFAFTSPQYAIQARHDTRRQYFRVVAPASQASQGYCQINREVWTFSAWCGTLGFINTPASNPYKRHRFPAEIISHCVWLYFRFCLRYRDVEEMMVERGVRLTYEAVR